MVVLTVLQSADRWVDSTVAMLAGMMAVQTAVVMVDK
jgi:hypothetical protein